MTNATNYYARGNFKESDLKVILGTFLYNFGPLRRRAKGFLQIKHLRFGIFTLYVYTSAYK